MTLAGNISFLKYFPNCFWNSVEQNLALSANVSAFTPVSWLFELSAELFFSCRRLWRNRSVFLLFHIAWLCVCTYNLHVLYKFLWTKREELQEQNKFWSSFVKLIVNFKHLSTLKREVDCSVSTLLTSNNFLKTQINLFKKLVTDVRTKVCNFYLDYAASAQSVDISIWTLQHLPRVWIFLSGLCSICPECGYFYLESVASTVCRGGYSLLDFATPTQSVYISIWILQQLPRKLIFIWILRHLPGVKIF